MSLDLFLTFYWFYPWASPKSNNDSIKTRLGKRKDGLRECTFVNLFHEQKYKKEVQKQEMVSRSDIFTL